MTYKRPKESKTIRDFSAGAVLGIFMVLLWSGAALAMAADAITENPIPSWFLEAGVTLAGASGWAIKRRFGTHESLWR